MNNLNKVKKQLLLAKAQSASILAESLARNILDNAENMQSSWIFKCSELYNSICDLMNSHPQELKPIIAHMLLIDFEANLNRKLKNELLRKTEESENEQN